MQNQMELGQIEKARLLEIYFAKIDGLPLEHDELSHVAPEEIKNFLLTQKPADDLLQQILSF